MLRSTVAVAVAFTLGLGALPGSAQETTSSTAGDTSSTETTAAETTTTPVETTAAETTTTPVETTAAETTESTATESTATPETTAAPESSETTAQSQEATTKAQEVNAATARLGDLTNALADAQTAVDTQSAQAKIAEQQLDEARKVAAALTEDADKLEEQVRTLEAEAGDQAIRSFMGSELDIDVLTVGTDPSRGMRMQSMLAKATRSDIDVVVTLSGAREDLLAQRRDAEEAANQAELAAAATEEELKVLEANRSTQSDLVTAADDRLDHLLSEQAGLADLGGVNTADVEATQALAAQLSGAPRPPSSASSTPTQTISDSDIQVAAKGIEVHVDIVDDIRRLLADAAADGVNLSGGGYRSPDRQIAVRKNNCGTSPYAIYEMPSSRCSPPTARPGRSMHEQGKAIDFTYNGALIRSRSGPGWNWLKANAASYGLYNLPSEPWHWSTTGR